MSLKKNLPFFAVLLLLWLGSTPLRSLQAQNDFPLIMDRIRAAFTTGTVTAQDNAVTASLATQAANGSWPDINYADQSATNWQPGIHWERISLFARTYSRVGSSYYGSSVLRQAIINGINYWLSLAPAPNSTNWYMLSISLPENIGNALVAMRYGTQPLSSSMENALIAWMVKGVPITRSPAKDGSNLTDVAQHYIARACLKEDQALLEQTVLAVSNSLVIVSNSSSGNINEGLQKDNSFTAHGPQLYLYGYGSELVSGVSNIAGYVTGTAYAFSPDKMAIFSNFVRGSFLKATRGMYHDFNAFNRQISRPNDGRPNQFIVRNARNADLPEYAAEYNTAISRINGSQPPSYQVAPEHIHFWRTDYTVHHRPSYMFGLRSVSTRTAKSENGNGENLKGYYMTEGANYIAVNGDEYYNIYPVWEWNKIPGTTVPEITTYPLRAAWGVNLGTSGFVGGVSDGQYGASTYAMNDYNTTAKKSWFFFDDEVVCLGAGIGSTAAQAINTTVNQCLLDGAVNVKTNAGTQALANGSRQYAGNLQWAHHDNVGYFFPQGGNISLSNQAQSGTQKSINNSYSTTLITRDVFKLWFQHGVTPVEGSYAYIVTPGKTLAEMEAYNSAQVDVWANTATQQAVYHSGLDMLQVVFYQPGSITKNGITVKASSPCALVLKNISTANVALSVADPNQILTSLSVSVQNPLLGGARILTSNMPNGLMAGSTFSGIINTNTPVGEVNTDPPVPATPDIWEPVGDAYVRSGSFGNTNFPTGNLIVKNDAGDFARRALIQFNLDTYNRGFDSASLRVRVNNAGATISSTSWQFYEVPDNNWTETGITWNNQPPVGSNLIATVQGKAGGTIITVPITNPVKQALLAGKKLSVRISSTTVGSTTDAGFNSREATTASQRPALLLYGTTDITAPGLILPPDVEENADPGAASATGVGIGQPVVTDKYGVQSVTNNAPAEFPVGVTNVTWTAVDNFGNVATGIQKVTIKDVEPPVITAPANVEVTTDAGTATAGNVPLGTATSTDNDGVQSITNNAPLVYPVGVTTVTWTATDHSGNTATATQTVTVKDMEPPVITAPANVEVTTDAGTATAGNVPLGTATATDNDGVQSITNNAPLVYPVGVTTITWTATDHSGNTATATQSVTVMDNELPSISVPAAQSFCSAGSGYQVPEITAADNCGVDKITYVITGATQRSGNGANASGTFNVGVSTITWTVTDINGNSVVGASIVEVYAPVLVSIPEVYALNPPIGSKNTLYFGYGPSTITLMATATGGTPGYQFVWNTGGETSSIAVSADGNYSVVVTDAHNCEGTASIQIQTVDVRCGNNNDKVLICHNGKTICIALSAVASHLEHGDLLGDCGIITQKKAKGSNSDDYVKQNRFEVYPNPASEFVYLELSEVKAGAEAVVYTVSGQVAKTIPVNQGRQKVSLSGLPTGTYFILVKNGKELFRKTVIKR